jgi:hypothetical protein
MKKSFLLFLLFTGSFLAFYSCGGGDKKPEPTTELTTGGSTFKPVPMPDPGIPGYKFPENQATLEKWTAANNQDSLLLHSWGLWTSLTMPSGEKYNGEELRVFETWNTPEDLIAAMNSQGTGKLLKAAEVPRSPGKLRPPNQILHAIKKKRALAAEAADVDASDILGFVKYDPSAAAHIERFNLLNSDTLNAMLAKGDTAVPAFPVTSMSLKPVFQIISKNKLNNGLYKLKVWTGPPNPDTIAYPSIKWPACVYVDPAGNGKGNGSVDMGCKGATPQTTYNVSDFIHFKLDSAMAAQAGQGAAAGDYAILVAMHITSREVTRWVWQTMWWSPDADNPPLPSSKANAAARPAQLKGAARHYAMAIAYTFINPDQPLRGGNNVGTSIYTYNPYLEAGFGNSTFDQVAVVMTGGKKVVNNVGVRTNCMSCHGQANWGGNNPPATSLGYIADTYISMSDPGFKGTMQIDFLWSIQGNATVAAAKAK